MRPPPTTATAGKFPIQSPSATATPAAPAVRVPPRGQERLPARPHALCPLRRRPVCPPGSERSPRAAPCAPARQQGSVASGCTIRPASAPSRRCCHGALTQHYHHPAAQPAAAGAAAAAAPAAGAVAAFPARASGCPPPPGRTPARSRHGMPYPAAQHAGGMGRKHKIHCVRTRAAVPLIMK